MHNGLELGGLFALFLTESVTETETSCCCAARRCVAKLRNWPGREGRQERQAGGGSGKGPGRQGSPPPSLATCFFAGVMMASREPGRLNMGWQRVSIQEEWHDPGSGAADAHVLQSSAHPRILRVTGGSLVAPEMDLSQSKQCTATINVAPGAGKKRTVQVTALVAGQEVQLVLNLE